MRETSAQVPGLVPQDSAQNRSWLKVSFCTCYATGISGYRERVEGQRYEVSIKVRGGFWRLWRPYWRTVRECLKQSQVQDVVEELVNMYQTHGLDVVDE